MRRNVACWAPVSAHTTAGSSVVPAADDGGIVRSSSTPSSGSCVTASRAPDGPPPASASSAAIQRCSRSHSSPSRSPHRSRSARAPRCSRRSHRSTPGRPPPCRARPPARAAPAAAPRSSGARCRHGHRARARLEGESQLAARPLETIGERAPVGAVGRADQPGADDVAREVEELARRRRLAEELGGRLGQLVRLVEHHRVGGRQQFGDRVLAQREVGAEQVMVDDDEVGGERLAPRAEHEAARQVRAVLPEAVLAGRGRPGPGGIVLGEPGAFGPIAGRAGAREPVDPAQLHRRAGVGNRPSARWRSRWWWQT